MSLDHLSPRDTAPLVGVAVRTLETWRRIGVGPVWFRTESGFIRYRRGDVHAYLDRHGPGARSTGGRPRTRGCGTEAGYRWHRRHQQGPCEECRTAHRAGQGRPSAAMA